MQSRKGWKRHTSRAMRTRSWESAWRPGVWVGALAMLVFAFAAQADEQTGPDRVRDDLIQFVRSRVESPSATVEMPPLAAFDVDRVRFPGALRTEFSTRSEGALMGRVPITVTLFAGEILVKRAIVSPYVRVTEQIVVPTRDLRRGEILESEDLRYVKQDSAALPSDAVVDVGEAVGLRVKRSLHQDQAIRVSQLEGIPVVERGDRVLVVLESGALRVQSIGKAKESGLVGEFIRVLNLDSKREVSGRLDEEGRVHVVF